ncbi:MAG: hypothetical protein P1U56_16990 [Saprospiraceae bacterium]|nr:hypothetical protein [Saprospiraceae bacterium]
MHKLKFALYGMMICICVPIFAQQNVGIGTTDPQEKLHIFSNSPALLIQNDHTSQSGRIALRTSNFTGYDMYYKTDQDYLAFEGFESGNSLGTQMAIQLSSGNVGIGTIQPEANLHISTILGNSKAWITSGFNTNSELALAEAFGSLGVKLLYNGLTDQFSISEIGPFAETFMVIDRNSTNVGFGTDSPAGPIEIERISNSTLPNYMLLLHNNTNANLSNAMIGFSASAAEIGSGGFTPAAIGFVRDKGLVFRSSTGSDDTQTRMLIDGAGNISMGTETPATGHKLSVDGKIACEEVRVELSDSWPDYVFSQSYNLPTLGEVRSHITEKGHLPGIPSAREVEENGLVVGEMQRNMMEKIEELTLYILQQDERIKKLETQLKKD